MQWCKTLAWAVFVPSWRLALGRMRVRGCLVEGRQTSPAQPSGRVIAPSVVVQGIRRMQALAQARPTAAFTASRPAARRVVLCAAQSPKAQQKM